MQKTKIDRITIAPVICHGKPTIRNMRYPVEMILDLLSAGMTNDEIIEDYPALEFEDIQAALQFGTSLLHVKSIQRVLV
ncbi:MAG: DUF433 domain-containing protein [Candidatus Kapabacteria bacterium]|jgi:uncharacterized protein (DUF433 family)|nr:DUF433 domain-containing protein [Candidatus Kapabacteria bacterium]